MDSTEFFQTGLNGTQPRPQLPDEFCSYASSSHGFQQQQQVNCSPHVKHIATVLAPERLPVAEQLPRSALKLDRVQPQVEIYPDGAGQFWSIPQQQYPSECLYSAASSGSVEGDPNISKSFKLPERTSLLHCNSERVLEGKRGLFGPGEFPALSNDSLSETLNRLQLASASPVRGCEQIMGHSPPRKLRRVAASNNLQGMVNTMNQARIPSVSQSLLSSSDISSSM